MTTLFGSDLCLKNILKLIGGQIKHLKQIVCFDAPSDDLKELAQENNVLIFQYHLMLEQFSNSEPKTEVVCTRETIFTISYTSGTSGNSKGVMLSNGNFLSGIKNILELAHTVEINGDDVYISYLPLAHVFDRLGVHTLMAHGGQVGFFGGKILEITADLQLLRPTIFASVPRLLNKVYDRVMAGVNEQPMYKKFLFYQGLVSKGYYNSECGWVENRMFDKLVFSKAKERLGGRVRVMITASAPISSNVLKLLRCVFCCPIVEAYGQTESCGASFATKVYDE